MTNLEMLIGMKLLWEGEQIEWKVPPRGMALKQLIESWIRKYLKGKITPCT